MCTPVAIEIADQSSCCHFSSSTKSAVRTWSTLRQFPYIVFKRKRYVRLFLLTVRSENTEGQYQHGCKGPGQPCHLAEPGGCDAAGGDTEPNDHHAPNENPSHIADIRWLGGSWRGYVSCNISAWFICFRSGFCGTADYSP